MQKLFFYCRILIETKNQKNYFRQIDRIGDIMEFKERINLCLDLITCSCPMFHWIYAPDGALLHTNCPNPVFFNHLLNENGSMDFLLPYARTHRHPVLLTSGAGLEWIAAMDKSNDELHGIYVLGPVFTAETSTKKQEQLLHQFSSHLSGEWQAEFLGQLRSTPVLSISLFFQYALMLHYALTEERITNSEIHFQEQTSTTGKSTDSNSGVSVRDRSQTWKVEQMLLDMVRQGNINFKEVKASAPMLSDGVKIRIDDSLRQAKDSVLIFISLCTRAAIEGGLSPEKAYTVGDMYIQSLELCSSIPEAASISNTMYEDFIQRVHKLKNADKKLSPQLLYCCDYIQLHVTEHIELEHLAQSVGYTGYYLSRKFKSVIGVSISEYIRTQKLKHAALLLTTSTQSMQEISDHLDFCSRSYFSDLFHREYGMTPTEYREKNLKI